MSACRVAASPSANVETACRAADPAAIWALFAGVPGMEQTMARVFCACGQPLAVADTVQRVSDGAACISWLCHRRPGHRRQERARVGDVDDRNLCAQSEAAGERARRRGAGRPIADRLSAPRTAANIQMPDNPNTR